MSFSKISHAVFVFLFITAAATGGLAANQVINAGGTLTLSANLTLTGSDSLLVNGTVADSCTITGNGYQILTSGTWAGLVRIRYAKVHGLGTASLPGISLTAAANNLIDIQHSIFDACGGFAFTNNGTSTTTFNHNIVKANSLVPSVADIGSSGFQVQMRGASPTPKYFQGNRIYKAWVEITGANSMIGGVSDTASNILIGKRVQINGSGAGTLIRNNYLHLLLTTDEPYWSQVHTLTSSGGALCEYNVIRDGEWIVQMVDGDFRYNVLCEIEDHNLYRGGSKGRLYRNLFLGYTPPPPHQQGQMMACITVIANNGQYAGPGIEIFNNVFDGNDQFSEPAVESGNDGLIKSLRNNVFYRFKQPATYIWYPNAIINTAWDTPHADTTTRAKMQYADYNCFYSPTVGIRDNYYLTVTGKTERTDDGFAKHDLPANGAVDAQADPMFQGPGVTVFPYNDSDIVSKTVTVTQMVTEFFARYTPRTGSPLIDAGDPADGIGTDIGAVETGTVGIGKAECERLKAEEMRLEASPNPFNPSTMIEVRIAKSEPRTIKNGETQSAVRNPQSVKLSVYNPSGRLVATLINQPMTPGQHIVTWDAQGLPSGLYVARLQVGNRVLSKAIMLMK